MEVQPTAAAPWYATRRFTMLAMSLLVAIAIGEGVAAICLRDNDFEWHRNQGSNFLEGKLYRDHYLPARSFMDVCLALAPYRLTRAAFYLLSLGLLMVCCWL